jgi:hypothetical protein
MVQAGLALFLPSHWSTKLSGPGMGVHSAFGELGATPPFRPSVDSSRTPRGMGTPRKMEDSSFFFLPFFGFGGTGV